MPRQLSSGLRVHLSSDAADAIRTETFRGQSYTVVPVVALVEGVIQGLNAEEPEFAPAEEFGKFPMTWNGRPITMGHPRRNGVLCSANDPDIREEYEFGFMANTLVENGKLKSEAWLNDEIIEAKGGEFLATKERLLEGKMVEVSTGLFCDVFAKKGTYNSVKYDRAWANVVPDHLAFLEEGTLGACSVADGCGAPRLNSLVTNTARTNKDGEILTGTPTIIGSPVPTAHSHGSCCDACTKGDPCMSKTATTANEGVTDETPTTETPEGQPPVEPTAQSGSGEEGTESGTEAGVSEPGNETPDPEVVAQQLQAQEEAAGAFDRFVTNAIASGITFDNARSVVQQAVREHTGGYAYVMAMNTEQVAFEVYDCYGYENTWGIVAMNYSVAEDGAVTLTGEPVPVNLMTSIVPRAPMVANEGASGANQQQEEGQMPGTSNGNGNDTQTPGAGGELSSVNGAGADTPATPQTLDAFLASAPPEVAVIVNEGIALRTQKKTNLVKNILANSTVFSEDELNGKDIPELEKLSALAAPKQDYSGRSFPSTQGINTNAVRENQAEVPEPPRAFNAQSRRVADYNPQVDKSAASVN